MTVLNTARRLQAKDLIDGHVLRNMFLLSSSPMCSGTSDIILVANPAWHDIFGLPADDVVRMPVMDMVHPHDKERAAEIALRLREGDAPGQVEIRMRSTSGDY